jgi:hypothetical protein
MCFKIHRQREVTRDRLAITLRGYEFSFINDIQQ